MNADRTEVELEHFRQLLLRRAKRLVKLLELNGPMTVIAHAVALVDRGAWGYCPDQYGAQLASFGLEEARRRGKRCLECGTELTMGDFDGEVCASCCEKFKDEIYRDPEEN